MKPVIIIFGKYFALFKSTVDEWYIHVWLIYVVQDEIFDKLCPVVLWMSLLANKQNPNTCCLKQKHNETSTGKWTGPVAIVVFGHRSGIHPSTLNRFAICISNPTLANARSRVFALIHHQSLKLHATSILRHVTSASGDKEKRHPSVDTHNVCPVVSYDS